MATILTDNFNAYNDGDLNGQGSWSGDAAFDIQGDVVREGAKAVRMIGSTGSALDIVKTGSQLSEGKITVYHRRTSVGATEYSFPIRLYEDTTLCSGIQFADGTIYLLTNSVWVDTGYNFVADTWYAVEVEWREDAGNPQVRMRVDGGAWYGWYDTYADWTTGLNKLMFRNQSSSTTAYYDHVAENPIGPASLKTMNSILKANIKSINGIAIADVKSVNTIT